jgi:subtilisin family serine protease
VPPSARLTSFLVAAVALAVAALLSPGAEAPPSRAAAQVAATKLPLRSLPAPSRQRAKPTARPRLTSLAALVPNDPLWGASWSLAKVGAPAAWRTTTGSPDVVVAVLDTGVDAAHPDLQGAVLPGWDAVNEDADASDDHGHGTAVAGVIAARSNNGVGVTGACWRCALLPVKVIGGDGTGSAMDIAEGIVWAADHGATVLNLSFVLSGYDGAVAGAIDYARARGALVIAAAGNSGSGDPTFPASHPGVVGVTATDAADARYGWANHGSWVALAAPGCSQSTVLGGGYGEVCGTSSATAFVSGLAGLVRSLAGVDAALAYSTLAGNAARVGDFVAAGRVDAAAAVAARRRVSSTPPPADTPPGLPAPRPDRL